MNTVAIVQARMGSERLPGKVLRPILGEPMIAHVVRRAQAIAGISDVVVATSTAIADATIVEWAQGAGVPVFAGSEHDVLDRYVKAAAAARADIVVRITADCPLLDTDVSARVVAAYHASSPAVEYAVTTGYPRGLDTEVVSVRALEHARANAIDPAEREHVTLHISRHPGTYPSVAVRPERGDYSGMRWTVDTDEDLQFVSEVYSRIGRRDFGWTAVLHLLDEERELTAINAHVRQKEI